MCGRSPDALRTADCEVGLPVSAAVIYKLGDQARPLTVPGSSPSAASTRSSIASLHGAKNVPAMTASTPTRAGPRHGKLFNAIVDVCLVYGMDEATRELEIREEGVREGRESVRVGMIHPSSLQSILEAFGALLERPIKLQFLQVVAPGQVYPPRGFGSGRAPHLSPTAENNPFPGDSGPSRRFRMQDLGLAWETVETLHFFMYPGGCG